MANGVREVRAIAQARAVTVLWEHDGVGPPESFNVESRVSPAPWVPLTTVAYEPGVTSYSAVDPAGERGVVYRVNAVNASGPSAWVESNSPLFSPTEPFNVRAIV